MSERRPLVSVVIPAFNAARWLGDTLQSLVNQTTREFEVILVDDGSHDETLAIAEAFRPRLDMRVIREPHSGAPARPRNIGTHAARGELILHCDADDMAVPERLERTVRAWQAAGRRDCLIFGDYGEIDAQGRTTREHNLAEYSALANANVERLDDDVALLSAQSAFGILLKGDFVRPCTAATPKAVLERIGGFDESLRNGQDYDLYLRIAQGHPFVWVRQTLGMYRVAPGRISSRPATELAPDRIVVLQRVLKLPLTSDQSTVVRAAISSNYGDLGYEHGIRGDVVRSLNAYRRAFLNRPAFEHIRGMAASLIKSMLLLLHIGDGKWW